MDGRARSGKTLKNKLGEYVHLAASGETVLVTDRDRAVAEIVAPQAGRGAFLADAMLAEAVRRGWVTPPTLVAAGVPPRKPVMKLRDLMTDLDQARDADDLRRQLGGACTSAGRGSLSDQRKSLIRPPPCRRTA